MASEVTLTSLNIAQLLDKQQEQFPDKTAVISKWQGVSLTYETLNKSVREISGNLLRQGVRPQDRVVVLAGNTIEYVQLFLAVSAIGAIFTIINPTFTQDEILPAIEFVGKLYDLLGLVGRSNNSRPNCDHHRRPYWISQVWTAYCGDCEEVSGSLAFRAAWYRTETV